MGGFDGWLGGYWLVMSRLEGQGGLALLIGTQGVDMPETHHPKCDAERRAGRAATAFVKAAVARAAVVAIRDPKWGRYGGPVVANVDIDGRSLAALLIEAGLGRLYDGGRQLGWCE